MSVPRSFALPLPLHRGYRSLMNCRRSPCPHKLPHLVGKLAVSWIAACLKALGGRSEEHTSELQSLMRISYAVFCLNKKNHIHLTNRPHISPSTPPFQS